MFARKREKKGGDINGESEATAIQPPTPTVSVNARSLNNMDNSSASLCKFRGDPPITDRSSKRWVTSLATK